MISHGTTYSPGDDLCAPPTPLCWPVSTPQAAQQRLQFHMSKQRARFLADPTAHFLKIVSIPESSSSDPSSQEQGEIISIAKWHYYPQGFHAFSTAPENDTPDISGLYELGNGSYVTKQGEVAWPADMNVQLHNYILTARDSARATWQLPNTPCWILTHLVTRSSHRSRGAASLLISWGIDKARTEASSPSHTFPQPQNHPRSKHYVAVIVLKEKRCAMLIRYIG